MRPFALMLVSSLLPRPAPSDFRREARRAVREVERRHEVVFTFDDGPHPDVTPAILDALGERGVRAAFFACGNQLRGARGKKGKALLRRAALEGHMVGTHTVHHPRLSALDEEGVEREIDGGVEMVERAIGRRPTVFRPPFGDLPPHAETVLRKRELSLALWSTNVLDYRIADGAAIAGAILDELDRRGGGVVILHDTHAPSADALPLILDGISPLNERRVLEGRPALRVSAPDSFL